MIIAAFANVAGPSRGTPHQEVSQVDGPKEGGNGLVPGGGVMKEGWLIDGDDLWIWRFWRDESAWVRDPKVFLDRVGACCLMDLLC